MVPKRPQRETYRQLRESLRHICWLVSLHPEWCMGLPQRDSLRQYPSSRGIRGLSSYLLAGGRGSTGAALALLLLLLLHPCTYTWLACCWACSQQWHALGAL